MKSQKPNKEQILSTLRKHHASEDEKVLREVSYNLAIANVAEDRILERAAQAIERLRAGQTKSPLTVAKQRTQASIQDCPICRIAMSSVKLLDEKPAWYCADHRIVVPKPTE